MNVQKCVLGYTQKCPQWLSVQEVWGGRNVYFTVYFLVLFDRVNVVIYYFVNENLVRQIFNYSGLK